MENVLFYADKLSIKATHFALYRLPERVGCLFFIHKTFLHSLFAHVGQVPIYTEVHGDRKVVESIDSIVV